MATMIWTIISHTACVCLHVRALVCVCVCVCDNVWCVCMVHENILCKGSGTHLQVVQL